jgi:hypothetical protein
VVGGAQATGTYGLNGNAQVPTPVTITSSNPKVAQILDSKGNPQTSVTLTIPAQSNGSNFTITTSPVNAKTSVAITASSGGVKITNVLSVSPVTLQSLTLTPAVVTGGDPVTGVSVATLLLNGPAAQNMTVNLTTSYPAVTAFAANSAQDPVTYNQSNGTGTVVIPKGASSGTFLINTQQVQIDSPLNTVTIGAKANGVAASAKLQINPPRIQSITLSSSTVNGGTIVIGTIRLNSGAPKKGGAQVQLFSNSPSATLPLQVVVPAGATTTTFKIYTSKVQAVTTVTITGTYNGTASNVLTINP